MKNWTPIMARMTNIKTKKMKTWKRPGIEAINVFMSVFIFSNRFNERSGLMIRSVLNTFKLL